MQTVIIVIHLMVVLALVGVVLLQRSEGGGLGIGGGSGFMTARGAANALTRTTGILAIAFFATWFPRFLMETRGVPREAAGDLAAWPPLAGMFGGLAGGVFSDWVLRRTGSARLVWPLKW